MSIVPTNINNYLRQFAYQLEERILQQFPPLHHPDEPLPAELARLRRTPYPAQALAIAGISKRWEVERSAGAIAPSDRAEAQANANAGRTSLPMPPELARPSRSRRPS